MGKGYRSYQPDQDLLLPPSLRDWLPESHLVYFVSDMVDQLDLTKIHAAYENDLRGQPPYDPSLMIKLLVYGYCVGVFSSRKIQKRLQKDIPFRVLAAGNTPDFRTISEFRRIHLEALRGLCAKLAQMIARSGNAQFIGNPQGFLSFAKDFVVTAVKQGTYAAGDYISKGGSTIYRVGNDFLTVAGDGRILSYVQGANAGGVATKYSQLGGK